MWQLSWEASSGWMTRKDWCGGARFPQGHGVTVLKAAFSSGGPSTGPTHPVPPVPPSETRHPRELPE